METGDIEFVCIVSAPQKLLLIFQKYLSFLSVQISLVALLGLTLCDSMDCSMPGFPVHHELPEPAQTYVHRVSDAWNQLEGEGFLILQIRPGGRSNPRKRSHSIILERGPRPSLQRKTSIYKVAKCQINCHLRKYKSLTHSLILSCIE